MTPPPDGWFDEFNSIRIPKDGSASSLEELVMLVCQTKHDLGIDLKPLSVETITIKSRIIKRNKKFYEKPFLGGPRPCDC